MIWGDAYSLHVGDECLKLNSGPLEGGRPLKGISGRWNDNIKIYVIEIRYENLNYTPLIRDRDQQ
jgi:hypothetical protein